MSTILITGANQGLGLETGRQLAKTDTVSHLFLAGRSEEKVKKAVQDLTAEAGVKAKIDYVVIDLVSDETIYAAAKTVESKLGGKGLDVLVNNAAIALDSTEDKPGQRRQLFQKTFDTNVFGTAVVIEAFLPLLQKGNEPRIVNIGSGLGSLATCSDRNSFYKDFQLWAYNSSKSALSSITVTTAMKYPDVHSVVIDPGYNATNMNQYSGTLKPEDGVKVIVRHALKRTGKSPGFYSEEGEVPW